MRSESMGEAGVAPEGVETDRPNVARLYDFFLGDDWDEFVLHEFVSGRCE